MNRYVTLAASAAIFAALPLAAQTTAAEKEKKEYPSPPEIVAKAKAEEWMTIAPKDLMVMDLAPDAKGKARRVVIQLMPPPFSQGWVGNIRKLAAVKWWDGTSINRVQDNYVVQWGDATEKKELPEGLVTVPESEYETAPPRAMEFDLGLVEDGRAMNESRRQYPRTGKVCEGSATEMTCHEYEIELDGQGDTYAFYTSHFEGWPLASNLKLVWPTHCYGMVGVGRNLSPDTGTGAELYTVIGHAPRHLDRNIALVGRVIEGIEHLSSLPRGTGPLGFYEKEEERVPIASVRLGNEIADLPAFEYLSTESASFAAYADARANRRDPFFIMPAGGADICNIPVPGRRKTK